MTRAQILSSVGGALLAGSLLGCGSVRGDEALVVVDVLASLDMPPFTTVRFSVVGRPAIKPVEAGFDSQRGLRFGYYLPGPNGTAEVRADALSSPGCIVGGGTAEVEVKLGRISSTVPLVVHRALVIDPVCLLTPDAGGDGGSPNDGALDGDDAAPDAPRDGTGGGAMDSSLDGSLDGSIDGSSDGSGDARSSDAPGEGGAADAASDTRADVVPPPPACLVATRTCSATSACCAPLACSTNVTYGTTKICCGEFNAGCTRVDTGQDCCGQLECRSGKCCLPARYACPSGGSCCDTLACSTNVTYGTTKICCGNNGHACDGAGGGSDCCGLLRCVANVCRP